jgi:hypothetical protein
VECDSLVDWYFFCNKLIGNNYRSEIITEISHISFPELRELCLDINEIVYVEKLARIFMPKLDYLQLSKITMIKIKIE